MDVEVHTTCLIDLEFWGHVAEFATSVSLCKEGRVFVKICDVV